MMNTIPNTPEKKPLKEKRTQLELFFEAITKADPEDSGVYNALFNPVAYSHFRTLEAITQDQVHKQLQGSKFYEEYREEVYKIVRLATAATIDVISETYKLNKERSRMIGKKA